MFKPHFRRARRRIAILLARGRSINGEAGRERTCRSRDRLPWLGVRVAVRRALRPPRFVATAATVAHKLGACLEALAACAVIGEAARADVRGELFLDSEACHFAVGAAEALVVLRRRTPKLRGRRRLRAQWVLVPQELHLEGARPGKSPPVRMRRGRRVGCDPLPRCARSSPSRRRELEGRREARSGRRRRRRRDDEKAAALVKAKGGRRATRLQGAEDQGVGELRPRQH
mmetsp:Transcript_39875/g.98641  ORF Transcript_39875/g.98641 Transcript_39875/m.98641 type:complete len:230 (+) Transcript_39875:72-761(+)